MQNKIADRVLQSLIQLDLTAHADYQNQLNNLLDEQPYLIGFLFNLAEDFEEQSHELLMHATLALHNSLSDAGLFFNLITPEILEETLNLNVNLFDSLTSEDGILDQQALLHKSSSPVALQSLLTFVTDNTEQVSPVEYQSIVLILNAVIEMFEHAATVTNPSGENE